MEKEVKINIPRFIYVENGEEKTSFDENERRKYIDELNRRLWGRKGYEKC